MFLKVGKSCIVGSKIVTFGGTFRSNIRGFKMIFTGGKVLALKAEPLTWRSAAYPMPSLPLLYPLGNARDAFQSNISTSLSLCPYRRTHKRQPSLSRGEATHHTQGNQTPHNYTIHQQHAQTLKPLNYQPVKLCN